MGLVFPLPTTQNDLKPFVDQYFDEAFIKKQIFSIRGDAADQEVVL